MGRDFGELGKAKKRSDDTFRWFGTQVRVGPRVSNLLVLDFLKKAEGIPASDREAGMNATVDFLKNIVHEGDWDTFWETSIENGQDFEDLMVLIQTLTGKATGRPTQRRSASSAGRRSTGAKSKGGSSLRVIRDLEREGRPDKALAVLRAQEARRAG